MSNETIHAVLDRLIKIGYSRKDLYENISLIKDVLLTTSCTVKDNQFENMSIFSYSLSEADTHTPVNKGWRLIQVIEDKERANPGYRFYFERLKL